MMVLARYTSKTESFNLEVTRVSVDNNCLFGRYNRQTGSRNGLSEITLQYRIELDRCGISNRTATSSASTGLRSVPEGL